MVRYVDYRDLQSGEDVIRLYDPQAFAAVAHVSKLAAQCLDEVAALIAPGVTTKQIDDFVLQFAHEHQLIPATLNYHGYRHACCTSVNHVICHGIPNHKCLRENDIINVDVTFILDGWHGDTSRMYPVGAIKRAASRLLEVTHECLMRAIAVVRPGVKTGAIGQVIQHYAESQNCSVVRDFCGHGLGRSFHENPQILHYGKEDEGIELREGMIFTIEPMINLGKPEAKILADGWTAVTRDRSLSAQYEHTLGVTDKGCKVFTLSPKEIFYL